jgi:hypothetical protein
MAAFPIPGVGVASSSELVLRAAVAAYLGRYRGLTRQHCESDLRVFLRWCSDQRLDPLTAVRVDVERYVRWLQDVGHYQPSAVSRRLSIVTGFYRVCVIDGLLPHSPADYVRRPTVPAESPAEFISSTTRSPASMSTPAVLYVWLSPLTMHAFQIMLNSSTMPAHQPPSSSARGSQASSRSLTSATVSR